MANWETNKQIANVFVHLRNKGEVISATDFAARISYDQSNLQKIMKCAKKAPGTLCKKIEGTFKIKLNDHQELKEVEPSKVSEKELTAFLWNKVNALEIQMQVMLKIMKRQNKQMLEAIRKK